MAADLQAVDIGPDVIGVMDRPGGQPKHFARQCRKHLETCGVARHGGFLHRDFPGDVTAAVFAKNPKFWRYNQKN
jgi:hypothetical protein